MHFVCCEVISLFKYHFCRYACKRDMFFEEDPSILEVNYVCQDGSDGSRNSLFIRNISFLNKQITGL